MPGLPEAYSLELAVSQILQIGRKPGGSEKTLALPSADVSATHAEIRRLDDGWMLIDLESTNGTRLNGKVLVPFRRYKLRSRDRISIASCLLLVEIPDEEVDRSEDDLRSCHYDVRPISHF